MNKPLSEKEKVLTMLTEIHSQLENLEVVLEASFSEQRKQLKKQEQSKLEIPVQQIAVSKRKIDQISTKGKTKASKPLKLEMGF